MGTQKLKITSCKAFWISRTCVCVCVCVCVCDCVKELSQHGMCKRWENILS